MPSALKTAEQYGDDLAVVFVEVQGASPEKAERFAWDQKWMGTNAIWTTERPFRTGSPGIPNFALLSSTGEVLMKGHPGQMHKQIIEAIDAEIEVRKNGPAGAPKSVKKHYKSLAKGKYAKALAGAQELVAENGEDAGPARVLVAEVTARVDRSLARVDTLLNEGMVLEAEELFESLAKGLKGSDAHAAAIDALRNSVEGADQSAAKKLTKIVTALEEDGPGDAQVAKLAKFVKRNGDGPVGARARRLLALFGG